MRKSVLICLVLFAAPLVAQEHPGKEIARHFNNNAGRPCVEYRDGSQTCLDGESDMTSSPALRPQNRAKFGFRQVANRKFWLIAAGMYASAFYDVEGAQHCIRVRACKEANPILGQTRGRQYGVKLGITTAALIPVYYLKRLDMQDNAEGRKSPFPWWAAAQMVTGTNLVTGTVNWRHTKHTNCPALGAGCR